MSMWGLGYESVLSDSDYRLGEGDFYERSYCREMTEEEREESKRRLWFKKISGRFHRILTKITRTWGRQIDFRYIWQDYYIYESGAVPDRDYPERSFQNLVTRAVLLIIDYLENQLEVVRVCLEDETFLSKRMELEKAKENLTRDSRNSKDYAELFDSINRLIDQKMLMAQVIFKQAEKEKEEARVRAAEIERKRILLRQKQQACLVRIELFEKQLAGANREWIEDEEVTEVIRRLQKMCAQGKINEVLKSIREIEQSL